MCGCFPFSDAQIDDIWMGEIAKKLEKNNWINKNGYLKSDRQKWADEGSSESEIILYTVFHVI